MTSTTPPVGERVAPAVMALAHHVRRMVIDCIARGITTPGGMADESGVPLGVRMLARYGVIEVDRTEPRRGALQHFYRFSAQAIEDLEAVRDFADAAIKAAIEGTT